MRHDPRGQRHRACEGSAIISNARLSAPTRVPEREDINKLARHSIVEVVPYAGQDHTTHALGTGATSRRAYARLRAQHIQHLGNVVVYGIGCRWPVSRPPFRRLLDLSECPRGDPDLAR